MTLSRWQYFGALVQEARTRCGRAIDRRRDSELAYAVQEAERARECLDEAIREIRDPPERSTSPSP